MSAPPPLPGTAMSWYNKRLSMIVDSYSEAKKLANGRCLRSVAVAAGGHSWRIAFYPNGRLAVTTGSVVSVYLVLDDAGTGPVADGGGVRVESRFALHEVGCTAPHLVSSTVAGALGGGRQETLGCERFVSREDLESLDLVVKHNRFVIRCDFTVFPAAGAKPASGLPTPAVARPPPSSPSVQQAAPTVAGANRAPPRSSPPPPPPQAVRALRSMSGLPADLSRLLETEAGSDVDLEVCDRVFAAHKLVLAARSPVFMADFFGPAKEKATGYIRICDMHPDAFEALLHYIYTDTLPATATTTSAREEAAALAQDLLVAADRYNLKDLKSLTENRLCKHSIGVSTVLPMLALAEHLQCLKLKKKCLDFIASGRNTRAVMATDDVEHLARSCPSVVREVLGRILDAREATPRNPLMAMFGRASVPAPREVEELFLEEPHQTIKLKEPFLSIFKRSRSHF